MLFILIQYNQDERKKYHEESLDLKQKLEELKKNTHDEKYSHKDCTSDLLKRAAFDETMLNKNFKNCVARCEELEKERESIMKKNSVKM